MRQKIVVTKDGTGDFSRIQDAIDHVRVHPLQPVTIFLKEGIYVEKVTIPDNKPFIKIVGDGEGKTTISYNDSATMKDSSGKPLGTFRTPVFSIFADNIRLENLTIKNTAGFGEVVGQAVSLYVSGRRNQFYNVRLSGYQDTLYTSHGSQLFQNCYIEGDIDFIFGAATAVFLQCEIHSLRRGYITAASTPKDQKYGYVFLECKITGSAKEDSVYLGRPWRPYAHTYFIHTYMGPHIKKEGWDNWRDQANEETARYGEYECSGSGSQSDDNKRVEWAIDLSNKEDLPLTVESVFPDYPSW
ncbi:pectinesterase family protein [Sutcliffiella horikoshii]|uniref:pectinesterase family protein n=1 Tax=Sutcliffiella horikoshii TaxID=79883 RepID=UPI001EEE8C46|nr:pectinesterase family protein [Sutcliffiella horikoshii]MCG1021855.1 pectin esterase [Sutcliffiella horikoshii]